MKQFAWLLPLTFLTLTAVPTEAAAQCETPESCYNTSEGQFCGGPGGDSWDYEDCHISGGFCQLSFRCDPFTFNGGMTSSRYAQLPADRAVTPAGTYLPIALPAIRGDHGTLKTCSGFVIKASRSTQTKPERILLDG